MSEVTYAEQTPSGTAAADLGCCAGCDAYASAVVLVNGKWLGWAACDDEAHRAEVTGYAADAAAGNDPERSTA